jgi:RNA polymerase sigma-70 factor (ECF subfamily)
MRFTADDDRATFMTDWDAIVADHGPAVWSNLWRLLADRGDVEECFQETFVAALKFARREAVQSWPALLCRLATARATDQLRKRYRQGGRWHGGNDGAGSARYPLAEAASPHAGPEEHAVAVELSERLRAALGQLPEKQAEVFCLHAICGWTYRELGERMRMTDSAVGVTIHRARRRLRTLLDDGQ